MSVQIMNNIKILCYDRIEVSEKIDVDKTSEWKESDICQYWYFLNKGLKYMYTIDAMIY